jgi:hypothetical protein
MDGAIRYWHWLLRTLIKPYVDGFLLESEAEALTTNERDLPLFNHPINSTGAHAQVRTEFFYCEEPLAFCIPERVRCPHYLHGTPPHAGLSPHSPIAISEGIAVCPAMLTTCIFFMAELSYEKWDLTIRFLESGLARVRPGRLCYSSE